MSAHFVLDPDGDAHLFAKAVAAHDLPSGTCVVQVPGHTGKKEWLLTAVLNRLGKTMARKELTRAANQTETLTTAWLTGMRIRRMIVLNADMLTSGDATRTLLEICAAVGVDTYLVADCRATGWFRSEIQGWVTEDTDAPMSARRFSNILDSFPRPHRRTTVPDRHCPVLTVVPRTGYLTFRADMRDTLRPEAFAHADAIWTGAYDDAARHRLTSTSTAGPVIHRLVTSTRNRSEQTIIVRAIQAAAWRQGAHLKIKLDRVLTYVAGHATVATLTTDEWELINSSLYPWLPATVALHAAGADITTLTTLPAQDVAADGRHVVLDGRTVPIPVGGRAAIVAQHVVHAALGHPPHRAFLTAACKKLPKRRLTDGLNHISRTTAVHVRDPFVDDTPWWTKKSLFTAERLEHP